MFPFFLILYNGSQVSIVALWVTCIVHQIFPKIKGNYNRIVGVQKFRTFISIHFFKVFTADLTIVEDRPVNKNCLSFVCFRLYGFKIHPLAYQLQYQAAANFKPMRGLGHNNSKR